MALQTKSIYDTGSKGHHKFTLKVTENSTSTSDNSSSVSFKFTMTDVKSGYDWYYSSTVPVTWSLTIAGKSYSGKIMSYDGSGTITLKSGTITVDHNSDGTKSISYKFSVDTKVSASYLPGDASKSGSMTLTEIPRASSLSLSATSVNVGSAITATISRKSTSFVHDVEFYINSTYYKKYTSVTTSKAYTIPTDWYEAMPSSTSCKAYCRITTKNSSGTQIGDKVTESFTVRVPSSVKPTIGTITLTPKDYSSNFAGLLIQGKNELTMKVSGCSPGTKSSITSYKFSGPGIETTTTKTEATASSVSSYGNLTYTLTVTDARGRSASKTATIYCHQYYKPTISITPYRSNSDGTKQDGGQYIWCDYKASFASVNDKNKITIQLYGVPTTTTIASNSIATSGSGKVDLGEGKEDVTYKVYAKITDLFGESNDNPSTYTIYGSQKIINISSDGTGVAIGKKADQTKFFDCKWPASFNGMVLPEIQSGSVQITPVKDTPTSQSITFPVPFTGTPNVVATAQTSVPGTSVLGVGVGNITTTGCNIYLTRANTTATMVHWVAVNSNPVAR